MLTHPLSSHISLWLPCALLRTIFLLSKSSRPYRESSHHMSATNTSSIDCSRLPFHAHLWLLLQTIHIHLPVLREAAAVLCCPEFQCNPQSRTALNHPTAGHLCLSYTSTETTGEMKSCLPQAADHLHREKKTSECRTRGGQTHGEPELAQEPQCIHSLHTILHSQGLKQQKLAQTENPREHHGSQKTLW